MLPLLIAGIVVCLALAIVGYHQRDEPGGKLFCAMMSYMAFWAVLHTLEMAPFPLDIKLMFVELQYSPIVTLPVLWFLFALIYTGARPVRMGPIAALLAFLPLVSFLLVITNDWHHLVWSNPRLVTVAGFELIRYDFGWWFWLQSGYGTILLAAAAVLFMRVAYRLVSMYRKEAVLLMLAAVLPMVVRLATIFLAAKGGAMVDALLLAYVLSGALLWFGTKGLELLKVMPILVPVAQGVVLETMRDGVIIFDDNAHVLILNPAVEAILGRDAEGLIGSHVDEFLGPAVLHRLAGSDISSHFEIELGGEGDGRVYEVSTSSLDLGWGLGLANILVLRDITDRKHFETQLEHQALHDPLTGLANRALLMNRIEQVLAERKHRLGAVYLLYFDIDDFKHVNNTVGYVEGDRLLRELVGRMENCCPSADTIARLGGDEFAVLLQGVADDEAAEQSVKRILDCIRESGEDTLGHFHVTASAGVARAVDVVKPSELLRQADVAMYAAKAAGKNRFRRFTPDMDRHLLRRVRLEADLKQMLWDTDLVVYYQPIVSLETARVIGAEALVRWQHPQLGILMPRDFMGIAEEIGLVTAIDRAVLRTACRDAVQWQPYADSAEGLVVSLNFSRAQILSDDLFDDVQKSLKDVGLEERHLLIEVAESAFIGDQVLFSERLTEIRQKGIRIAIDDFGVHYSSLRYLRSLPAQVIKLDRSFIADIVVDERSRSIVHAVTKLGTALDLDVIAEGIETVEQWRLLYELGCPLGQGFCVGRSLPAQDLIEYLRGRAGRAGALMLEKIGSVTTVNAGRGR
ncbi:MAG: putative bifunctional diguanylate cyclase/phosphodiesterase [Thermoleophilia bacterium]